LKNWNSSPFQSISSSPQDEEDQTLNRLIFSANHKAEGQDEVSTSYPVNHKE